MNLFFYLKKNPNINFLFFLEKKSIPPLHEPKLG